MGQGAPERSAERIADRVKCRIKNYESRIMEKNLNFNRDS